MMKSINQHQKPGKSLTFTPELLEETRNNGSYKNLTQELIRSQSLLICCIIFAQLLFSQSTFESLNFFAAISII
jgi:hypothetical protein